MKPTRLMSALILMAGVLSVSVAHAEVEVLDTGALQQQTAKGVGTGTVSSTGPGLLDFSYKGATGNGDKVDVTGNAEVLRGGITPTQMGGMVAMKDQAQQNLKALVNVNAASSIVQVLMNLNVAVNSSIGGITQGNLVPVMPR